MPAMIEHIDAIARKNGRDALYLEFHPQTRDEQRRYNHESDEKRDMVIAWLDEHGFKWKACGPYADLRRMDSYRGQIYLDVPFDESLPTYCELRDYLENPDGSMRHDGVRFYALPLAHAMKNAVHDAPGFWERWAEDL